MAEMGLMRVLVSAGKSAATRLEATPVTKPAARLVQETAISVMEVLRYSSDTVWPTALMADLAKKMPTATPRAEPTSAIMKVSPKKRVMIWRRVVPRARRMPIYFLRCTTEIETAL